MKKIIFVIALALGGLTTTFAQSTPESEETNTNTAVEAEAAVETEAAVEAEAPAQDEENYQEVAVEELPEAVTSAVANSYPTASINKAFKNEANEYKLEVALQDGTAGTLFADESGNWIE